MLNSWPRERYDSPVRLEDLLEDLEPEPHPALVAAQKPGPAELMRASGGLFPSRPVFSPVVPAVPGGV